METFTCACLFVFSRVACEPLSFDEPSILIILFFKKEKADLKKNCFLAFFALSTKHTIFLVFWFGCLFVFFFVVVVFGFCFFLCVCVMLDNIWV